MTTVVNEKKLPEDVADLKATAFLSTSEKIEVNWFHTALLAGTPLLAFVGICTVKPAWQTILWTVVMYFWTGMGITGGYHRLWSHRAYQAGFFVRVLLLLGGTAAFEGSARWWCRNHRAHHRYTDTEKDPYNAKKGFFYSHLGWMLQKQNAKKIGYADISDLDKDPLIRFQHKNYAVLALIVGIAFPTAVASMWGDALGGFFYAVMLRMVFVHHATFFVNSLAHWYGNKTFSDYHTAFDSFITAILTLGEGYHNYHHEFPEDYRNGIRFFQYDPTKWMIRLFSYLGLTFKLKRISSEEIEKARVQMIQRRLDLEKAILLYGSLPVIPWGEINSRLLDGEALVVIEGVVYDVKNFVQEHPGGRQTLLNYVGTDATELFLGKSGTPPHVHSLDARKLLDLYRVGILGN